VRKAAEGEDVSVIRSAVEALNEVIQKIGASVYQGQQAGGDAGQSGESTSQSNAGPDVVDGEVKE
jgi:hypothetical protein